MTLTADAEPNKTRYIDPVYNGHFGVPGEATKTRDARKHFVRYAVWAWGPSNDAAGEAFAIPSKMFAVFFHKDATTAGSPPVTGTNPTDTERTMAAVFMHELGHTLGLGHGGADGWASKPNSLSMMSYQPNSMELASTPGPDRTLEYSEQVLETDPCDLDENQVLLPSGPDYVVTWRCPNHAGRAHQNLIDFDHLAPDGDGQSKA